MKKKIVFFSFSAVLVLPAFSQHVGIGTTSPAARLHVADSAVLFTGPHPVNETTAAINPPVTGTGNRFMWYPARSAVRAGTVIGSSWDRDNIGLYSLAAGLSTAAKGDFSVSLGAYSTAAGTGSVTFGRDNITEKNYGLALGYGVQVKGASGIGLGNTIDAGGNYAVAIGRGIVTSGSISHTVLGSYNALVTPEDTEGNQWVNEDPLFSIGNGIGPNTRSTALNMLKNGNTGLGVLHPKTRLHVNGSITIGNQEAVPAANLHVEGTILSRRNSYTGSGNLLLEEMDTNDGSRITFRSNSLPGAYWDMYGKTNTANSAAYVGLYYSGVGGNNMVLYGNGNVWFRGNVSNSSDARLKKDISPIRNAAQKIAQVSGYHYRWKDEQAGTQLQTGVLAQEVEKVMPELVTTDINGNKAVNYISLLPYLLEVVKEQQVKLEALEKKIEALTGTKNM